MTDPTDPPPQLGSDDRPSPPAQAERRSRRVGTSRAFVALKAQHVADLTFIEWFAQQLTLLASSTIFLLVHVVWFLIWITWNVGLLGLEPFDPFPFGLLTMVVSLEAIFLSIFVLMGQRREAAVAELREEVTLHVAFRMEDEVTKLLQLMAGLYGRLGHRLGEDQELREMLQPMDPAGIERELLEQIRVARSVKRRAS